MINRTTKRYIAVFLFIVLILNLTAGCSLRKPSAKALKLVSPEVPGYDIVLALDESTSISKEGIAQRNEAAKMLVQLLSDDCRLAALFFAKDVTFWHTNGFVSTNTPSGKESLITTFDRTERINNGTDINAALTSALELHDEDSPNQKVIILMTDGVNWVVKSKGVRDDKKTAALDEALRLSVAEAQNREIPIYVMYIDDGKITKTGQEEVAHICELFGSDSYSPDELSGNIPENENMVVHLADMGDLRRTFLNLFGALKNISYKDFTVSESGIVDFSVPSIGATGVQIFAESNKAFSLLGMYNTYDGEQLVSPTDYAVGQPMVLNYLPKYSYDRIDEGIYQISFGGEGEITGAISIDTDFGATVLLTQSGSTKICRAVPTSVTARLLDKYGKVLDGGKKLTMTLVTQENEYPLTHNGNAYTAEGVLFDSIGVQTYALDIDYDGIHYTLYGKTEVFETTFLGDTSYKISVPSDYTGGSVKVCTLDECLANADTSKPVDVRIVSPDNGTAVSVQGDAVLVSGLDPKKSYDIELSFSDMCGKKQSVTIGVTLSKKLTVGVIILIIAAILLCAIILLAVFMTVVYGQKFEIAKRKLGKHTQAYKATVTTSFNGIEHTGHLIQMNSMTFAKNSAVRNICDTVFFYNGKATKLSDILAANNEPLPRLRVLLSSQLDPVVYSYGRYLHVLDGSKIVEAKGIARILLNAYLSFKKTPEYTKPGDYFTYHRNGEETCAAVPLTVGEHSAAQISYGDRTYYITVTEINEQ